MSAFQATALLTSILSQIRAYDRFESGRRVLAMIALGALAERFGEEKAWDRFRNVSAHGKALADQATALDAVACRIETAIPDLLGVFTKGLVPDVLQAGGELPGLTAIAAQALELSDLSTSDLGRWFDESLDQVSVGRHMGEYTTPRGLADLMARLATPEPGQRVLDPSCGLGSVLGRLTELTPLLDVHGQERSNLAGAYARLRLFLLGQRAEVRIENALKVETTGFGMELFDRVVCNPPFGTAGGDLEDELLKQRFPGIPFRYEALFLTYCVEHLAPGGRGVVLVPYPLLHRKGREIEFRKQLIEAGRLEGVIALPSGVVSWTDVPLALVMVRTAPSDRSVVFVDAQFLKAAGRRAADRLDTEQAEGVARLYFEGGKSDHWVRVRPHIILAAEGDLQPARYLTESTLDRRAPRDIYAEALSAEMRAEDARKTFDEVYEALADDSAA